MKPPMNQYVSYTETLLGPDGKPQLDKYGRPETSLYESIARVQRKSQLVRDAKGTERRVNLEIDLPPEVNPRIGNRITFQEAGGSILSGEIVAKDEAVNLAGTRVYYRTVFVDG